MSNRREFLKKLVIAGGVMTFGTRVFARRSLPRKRTADPLCTIFRTVNGNPDENIIKVFELMGGIEKIIGQDDVVIIKPNVQWWNQGATNLSGLKALVDLIMNRPGGFNGEVILAENCHRGPEPWKSLHSGWASRFEWNSDLKDIKNVNGLCARLKELYAKQFSICHWIDVGAGNKRVFGPGDGTGYVYCDGSGGVPLISFDNGAKGEDYRAVIMSYPVFKTDKGTIVDLKNGIWEKGAYTGQPLRFINFAALNHHSTYCAVTGALKNYLGVSDLTGGPDPHNGGQLTDGYYNFHSFPFNKWSPGTVPGMLGGEIGVFLNTIRRADLNIISAEWVGLASRTLPPMAHTRAVLACTDPVALDYHATKYLLYPNSRISIHNPDDKQSPVHQYLVACEKEGGGLFDETHVGINSYDMQTKEVREHGDLRVTGKKMWGSDVKTIMKYLFLRYWAG